MNTQALIERFNSLDVRIRCAVFAILVVVLLAVDYFLILRFQFAGLGKIDTEIKTIHTDTQRVEADLQRFSQTKQNLDKSASSLKMYNEKIRPRSQSSAVLEDISRMANESNVSIDQLAPSKEGQEALTSPSDIKYYALPIVIGAHAGYHMFGRFLNKIESNNVLVLMRDLRLEGSTTGDDKLSIQATVKIILWDTPTEPKK